MKPYYADDSVSLYLGDCREVSEWLAADVLVTDPPYGIAAQLEHARGGRSGLSPWAYKQIQGDADTTVRDEALAAWGDRPALVFGSWKRPQPAATRATLVWDKGEAAGMGDLSIPWKPNWESIYVLGSGFAGRRDSGILQGHTVVSWSSMGREHPHAKPVSLMASLIAKCPAGVIADPFAGSGTTLLAARSCDRRAVGVEIEEAYCEVIASRLAQGDLFGGAA